MTSLIRYFKANSLGVSTSSLSLNYGSSDSVLNDDSSLFQSRYSVSDQLWQVSFAKAVSI